MVNAIIRWSLNNRVTVMVAALVVTGLALFAASRMALDVFPEFAPTQVVIQTEAPGFSPEDVEQLVTVPIESLVLGAPGIDAVRSESSIGLSRVIVVFQWGTDIYDARQIVGQRLALIQDRLPPGVQAPEAMPATSAISWLQKFALIDGRPDFRGLELRTLADWVFRYRLLAQEGVASVVSQGGDVKQYQVLVDPLKLNQFDVALTDVVAAAAGASDIRPGAFIYPGGQQELTVRGDAQVDDTTDIAQVPVTLRDGTPITVGDVAKVKVGPAIKRGDARFNGRPAVVGTVSKLYGADTVRTTEGVEETLANLRQALPEGARLVPDTFSQASFIHAAIGNMSDAMMQAAAVVATVLLLFLFRWTPTIISFIAIPLSLLAAIVVLWLFGVGLNALVLGGLVIAIGEVVDDAVIDVENVYRRLRENILAGQPLAQFKVVMAASIEIRSAVVYATLIIVVVFLPVFFLQGIEGRIFAPLAGAYIAAIVSSLVVAVTVTPVLCYLLLCCKANRIALDPSPVLVWLERHYRPLLGKALARPRVVFMGAGGLLVLALVVLPFLGRSFLPAFHEGNIVIAVTHLPGTSLKENVRTGDYIQAMLRERHPQIRTVVQRAGRSRLDEDAMPVNFSEFDITLKPGHENSPEFMAALREDLASVPGITVNVGQFIAHRMYELLSGVRSQLAVKIYGSDLDTLLELAREVRGRIDGVAGVVDLQTEQRVTVPGIDIRVDRAAAARHGLKPADISRYVENAINGVVVGQVLEEGGRSFDILVRMDEYSRDHVADLEDLPLRTPDGARVRLADVAAVVQVQQPFFVEREGGNRRATVAWNVEGRDLDGVATDVQRALADLDMPTGYTWQLGGEYEGQQRSSRTLLLFGGLAVMLVFALLVQVFRSLPLALMVFSNLPLALIGGVLVLALARVDLNVSSMVGFIALFGIATRNGILLVSRYQRMLREHPDMAMDRIVTDGAVERMAPILMTAGTAALAVLPLLFGSPVGKEMEQPLAWVLLGGLTTSTLLNLVVVPAWFHLMGQRDRDALKSEDRLLEEAYQP
ncbi:MAG: efflux RND transporter permease subunit [Gammaproteobacteria bacterium]|nr:efflux RND transporter permease subunit [Gammaproteobacteria bacterium]